MAEIKLYGNAVNGDGKYIISPFDIAAPKADGKTAYTEDDKAADKNIVSYINSKVASLTSGIGAVKTGIQSASFSPLTAAPVLQSNENAISYISLSVLAKDGSEAKGGFTFVLPSANKIVQTASSYTYLVDVVNKLGTSYNTLNTTVTTINNASGAGSFRQGDADTLKSAKDYTDKQITGTLGTVYKVKGTKSLTEIKALTDVKEGDVYNVSNDFLIDGKHYSEYTNIVFLADSSSVVYNDRTGFGGIQVDALGGVQDLSYYSFKANTVSTVTVNDNNNALSDTGAQTTIATIGASKEDGTTQAPISVTAKLPTTLAKLSSPKITAASNKLSITGLTNLSGTTVTPLSYANTKVSVVTSAPSATEPQSFTVSVTGELGTTVTSAPTSLITADSTKFGVVKIGKGINVSGGVIELPKNTFTNTPYVSITSSTNGTNGTDFVFDITCCTSAPNPSIIPLQKCDVNTLGIKYNLVKATYVKVYADGLDMAFDDSALSTKITGIESRISALETLLSLA